MTSFLRAIALVSAHRFVPPCLYRHDDYQRCMVQFAVDAAATAKA
jgi:hypothetical protein